MFSRIKRSGLLERLDVKLTTYYTLMVLLIFTLVVTFFLYRLQHNLVKQVDRILHDEALELQHEIVEEKTFLTACKLFENEVGRRKYFPVCFKVWDAAGTLLYASEMTSQSVFPEPRRETEAYSIAIPNKDYFLRVFETDLTVEGGQEMIVQVATITKTSNQILENFYNNIFRALPVVIVLSVLLGMFASRKPRAIIRSVAQVANRITSQNLSERLPVAASRDEVAELSAVINSMMDRLEHSFNELRQFTADVSHELRNPLFALKGGMEVSLSQQRDPHEYREVLYECLERINFLIKLINDLFLISRFDTKKISLDLDYLNLGQLVREVYDFFLPMAQEKQLTINMDICDDVVLLGDKAKLPRVLSNLLDNAVKFTPSKSTIHIRVTREDTTAVLRVIDTGIGIPEASLSHIFDRLYQVDNARSGTERGTGLGLQISKRIVEAHGGSITAEKNPDRGMTFTVRLPVLE